MIRQQVQKILEDEKTQVAVAKVFERLKQAQVDNFLTNTLHARRPARFGQHAGRPQSGPGVQRRIPAAEPGVSRADAAEGPDGQ